MNTELNDEEMQAHLEQLAEQRSRNLRLAFGEHATPDDGLCLMEAVAYVAGEPHSANPQCASLGLAKIGQRLNDLLSEGERQLLIPLIPRLIGTRSTPEHDLRRAYLMIDLSIREIVPMGLHAVGWTDLATQLRAIGPIVDSASARAATEVVYAVRNEAFMRVDATYATYAATYAIDAAAASSYAADAASDAAGAAYAAAYAAAASAADAASDADSDSDSDADASYAVSAASYAVSAASYAVSAASYAADAASDAAAASYAADAASDAAAVASAVVATYAVDAATYAAAARRSIIEATVRAYERCILLPA